MPVALNSAATVMAVGRNGVGTYRGAIWVFSKDGNGAWNAGSQLTVSGAADYDRQGTAVALNFVGSLLAIGGPGADGYKGATWIFRFVNNAWTQEAKSTGTTGGVAPSGHVGGFER